VNLALAAALAVSLLLPAVAAAEDVPGSEIATDATLAVAPDGSPRVAFVGGGELRVAARGADGSWTAETAAPLPGSSAIVDSAAVAPGGASFVLVQDPNGRWLALEERTTAGWRGHVLVARVATGASLGLAGLALDAAGRPVVAYALRLPSRATFLRIVRPDARGRYVTKRVTRGGFPPSDTIPSATPVVLPSGVVRVVETYARATIEWTPKGRDWQGQFLYASALGSAAGPVAASAAAGGVYSAWTELFAAFGESHLVLTLHRDGEQTTILHRHAFLVGLAVSPDGPELAANDYVDGADLGAPDWLDYAGLVVPGLGAPFELAGKLAGYAVDRAGGRQYLLRSAARLEWYRSASLPTARVELTAVPAPGAVSLAGRVTGSAGGAVELYREQAGRAPLLVATVPLAADGSFAAVDAAPPAAALLYRAVFRDAAGGLPSASLLRAAVRPGAPAAR